MPIEWGRPQSAPSTAPARGSRLGIGQSTRPVQTAPLPVESEDAATTADDGGLGVGEVVGGVAALGGAAWLLSKLKNAPGVMGKVGKAAEYVDAARKQAMLSGLALPKSLLGNVGASVSASLERGSTAPLKEMFSGQTVKDAIAAYKQNAGPVGAGNIPRGVSLPGPMPGRIMGAFDDSAQKALQRGGLTAQEAEREVLQAPLPPQLAEALDSPLAQYAHPFRRTPFNQFLEGLKTLPGTKHSRIFPKTTAAYAGTGAVHGAATADDDAPVSVPIAMAATGKYGYTYGLAALLARAMSGGKNQGASDIASSMLPVSEYGITQSVTDPLKPFTKPAALSALERLSR